MKKTLSILLAAATLLAACTKSEIAYEQPQEIGFLVTTDNITKAAMEAGNLDTDETLGVWAFWDADVAPETVTNYANYTETYLSNAEFVYKTVTTTEGNSISAWGGDGVAYPWPIGGSLVFAGYNKTTYNQLNTYSVTYNSLSSDEMVFTDYTQSANTSESFDLCWFNHTAASYNYRTTGEAVEVVMSHALTWITIKVQGEGLPATSGWKITDVTLNDIANIGTGKCTGSGQGKATWTSTDFDTDVQIFDGSTTPKALTTAATEIETTEKGTVVIPQTPTTLSVTYKYPVGDASDDTNWKTKTETVPLVISDVAADNKWLSGTHYTYTLIFKSNEILVAPSYDAWAEATDKTITVE